MKILVSVFVIGLCVCAFALALQPEVNQTSDAVVHVVPVGPKKTAKAQTAVYRIGAFNIKTFGASKMGKPEIANVIRDIVLRYDVILIQEIRDATQESIWLLLNMLNRYETFDVRCSERLGRSSYKEQYCYYFRFDRLVYVNEHQYDDGLDDYSDQYEREPYSILLRPFGYTATDGWDIALVGLHAKPDHAVSEIKYLVEVYDDLLQNWPTVQNVLLIGDLNADCSYASERDLQNHIIYDQALFKWVIGFDADTTTSTNTNCAYDRIIAVGSKMQDAVIPGSEDIFRFEDVYNLSYSEMIDVSDHYPVEVEIYVS